jgi:hypothetical protein
MWISADGSPLRVVSVDEGPNIGIAPKTRWRPGLQAAIAGITRFLTGAEASATLVGAAQLDPFASEHSKQRKSRGG